jgi:hypothetical protein
MRSRNPPDAPLDAPSFAPPTSHDAFPIVLRRPFPLSEGMPRRDLSTQLQPRDTLRPSLQQDLVGHGGWTLVARRAARMPGAQSWPERTGLGT